MKPAAEAENPETDRLTNKDDELSRSIWGWRRERSQDDSMMSPDEDGDAAASRADAHTAVYAETAPTMRQGRCCFYFHTHFCSHPRRAAALIRVAMWSPVF